MMFYDPENTNEHLVWLFSKFGAVKGIFDAPSRPSQKFITFYDVRHAAAALRAMNRSAESLNKMPGQLTAQQVCVCVCHVRMYVCVVADLLYTHTLVGCSASLPQGWELYSTICLSIR
jgi:hypothetical protein